MKILLLKHITKNKRTKEAIANTEIPNANKRRHKYNEISPLHAQKRERERGINTHTFLYIYICICICREHCQVKP